MTSYTNAGVLLAAALVNSDCARKGELLSDGPALVHLLGRHGWDDVAATDDDATAARELRPALRAVFTAESPEQAVQRVNTMLERSGCVPRLVPGEHGLAYEFKPIGPLVQRIEGVAAGGLAEVLRAGGFDRMRTCADTTCSDVFVDASRNLSRRFCRPETCGNRNNVASYRARRRAAPVP